MNLKIYLFALFLLECKSTFPQQVNYNKNYQIACHNCYDPKYENITDVFTSSKAIEIDIWDNFQGSGFFHTGNKMNQDWYVKHTITDKGNVNCCGGSFRDCLTRIKKWSDLNANQDIITVFIDKKENWSDSDETRKPNDLDFLLLSIFGIEKLFTPSMLLNGQSNLKEATISNWQNLDSLKGKFIFIITNATEITPRNPLNEYLTSQKNNAICFVAPEIKNENEIQNPINFLPENLSNIIFYNIDYTNRNLALKINELNCLSRVFNSPESISTYNELVNDKVNFIVFDNLQIAK